MIKLIIFFTLLFFLFFLYKKLNVINERKKRIHRGKVYFLIFVLFFICLCFAVIQIEKNTDKIYNPPKFDGENLKPGFFSEIK